jgi:hypothetical protein
MRYFEHKIVYRLHRAIPIDFSCTMTIESPSIDRAINAGDTLFKRKHGGCIVMTTTTHELSQKEFEFSLALKGE